MIAGKTVGNKAQTIPALTHYCLLLALPIMALPHIEGLPWWIFAISGVVFSWQLGVVRWQWSLPPSWLRIALAITSMALIVDHYRSIQNLDAYVALLLTMHAQKVLEIRSRRDVFITVYIGLFCVGTRLLYVETLYAMLVVVLSVILLFFTLHSFYAARTTPLWVAIRNVLWLLLKASPIILVLFFLFPRIPPLIVIPDLSTSGQTGVSDRVSPGSLSSLAKSDTPVFRVRFEGTKPQPKELYWRGIVLEAFDGKEWHRGTGVRRTDRPWLRELAAEYPSYRYQMTIEPSNQYWLFTLATPYSSSAETQAITGFSLASTVPVAKTKLIDVTSIRSPLREGLNNKRLDSLRQLPRGNPKATAWAEQLAANAEGDTETIVRSLAAYLSNDFYYSLNPPLLSEQGVDDFLFNTKTGYCGHFASAAGFVLRAAGVPTRLVAGYMGGEINPYDDYILVRQLDAHAWVEYWLPDKGWQRFDPTALVAPERISQGSEASLRRRNEYNKLFGFGDVALLRNVGLWADALNHQWTHWFLEYDQDEQFALLNDVTGLKGSLELLVQALVGLSIAVTLPFFLFAILLRLRTNLPFALSLALADKGLALAGLERLNGQDALRPILADRGVAGRSHHRLIGLWDSAWYQGREPTIKDHGWASIWAMAVFVWGLYHVFIRSKAKPELPTVRHS